MKQVDLFLPFALPHDDMASDLLRAINAPALATLASRGKTSGRRNFDDFSRTLPHERWIAEQFGIAGPPNADNSPTAAPAAMQLHRVPANEGYWFILHPVHIHIARDHLVLTDVEQLALSDMESRLLFEDALPILQAAGLDARYGDAHTWFLRADDWSALQTATPDAAGGHNIDIWMPKGEGERAWRKVQNEIQMQWHTHAVNSARESSGGKLVNSLWLWGGAPAAPATSTAASSPYGQTFNLPRWTSMLGVLAPNSQRHGTADNVLAAESANILVGTDALIDAAFSGDWGTWLANMQALDTEWFAPLLAALKAGQIDHLRLILSHNTGLMEFSINRSALRKFWIGPSFSRLAQ